MKTLLNKSLWIMPLVFAAVSCSDSDEDVLDTTPANRPGVQTTRNILYVKDYGKQEMNMNTVEDAPTYHVRICKAGIDTSLPAHVELDLLTQKEVDDTYGLMDKMKYQIIPDHLYTLSELQLDIAPMEEAGEVDVAFHAEALHQYMMQHAEDVHHVLPLRILSENDSIDVLKNDVMLVLDVKKPQITFKETEVMSTMKWKSIDIELEANLENAEPMWNFTCSMNDADKEELVRQYNQEHGTNYLPMPSAAYEIPSLTFKQGISNTRMQMTLSREPLESDKNYVLPLQMGTTSLEGFDVDERVCFLLLENPKYVIEDCDRSQWRVVFCNSDQKNAPGGGGSDGGGAGMLLDNNVYTYWHANYEGPNDEDQYPQQFQGSRNLPITIVVEMQSPIMIHSIGWAQRQNSDFQDVKKIEYYVSDDEAFKLGGKEDYTPVALNNWEYLMEQSYKQINDVQWQSISEENAKKMTKGHLLKVKVVESYRPPHLASGGELYVRRVVAIDGEPVE